jgi:deoxyribose-phosphate aldolase
VLVNMQRVDEFVTVAKNTAISVELARKIFSLIDLTSLNDDDDESTLSTLCHKTITQHGHVAAICTLPSFVKRTAHFFAEKPIKVATVANFPLGETRLDDVQESIRHSIQNGAQEIDLVFPYRQYLAGDKVGAHNFVRACKDSCGSHVLLKVILETGELKDLGLIEEVSRSVLLAGADFLKTSTGKTLEGATLDAAAVMLCVIKELSSLSHRALGFKVSGGIRTIEQAAQYFSLVNQIMGPNYLIPSHFRIGASQLVDVIVERFP